MNNAARAMMIQRLAEYNEHVFPILLEVYNQYDGYVDLLHFNQWLIAELTEIHFGYNVKDHNRNYGCYQSFFDRVKNRFNHTQFGLDRVFLHYVRGPSLYVECTVRVYLVNSGKNLVYQFEDVPMMKLR